jgi:CheY-like chemotaxis protein
MPPEVIAHALEPFFTTKGIGKGSGLGLSQVYGFVSAAGGHVAIDSTPGLGTTVTMFLPRSLEPLTQETERPIPLVAARADGQETILLVEDEPTVRDVTVEGLEALGYQVRTAQDSTEALTVLRSASRIDVLFSDVMLPGLMNGSELAIEARRLRPDLKVLLTSGHTLDALREQGVRAELDVLSKPYRHEELARRLRMVIDGR